MKSIFTILEGHIKVQKSIVAQLDSQINSLWESIPQSNDPKALANSLASLSEQRTEADKKLCYFRKSLYNLWLAFGAREETLDIYHPESYHE